MGIKKADLYEETKKFVEESFVKKGKTNMKHFERTAYWVKKLYPEADEALLVASVAHDIERAFRDPSVDAVKNSKTGFLDKEYLKFHQEKGAEIIANFLVKKGANKDFIEKVSDLIAGHEAGGNKEQNILKDADSVSFFENNVEHFASKDAARVGKEKVREKCDWMFKRITFPKAKKIALPWYEKATKLLNQ